MVGSSVDVERVLIFDFEPGEEGGGVLLLLRLMVSPRREAPDRTHGFSGRGAAPGKAGVAVNLENRRKICHSWKYIVQYCICYLNSLSSASYE